MLLFISPYLPCYVTSAIIAAAGLFILLNKKFRSIAFAKKNVIFVWLFFIYSLVLAVINLNFIGVACSLGFLFIFSIFLFLKNTITKEVYENGLNACMFAGFIVSILTVFDFLINVNLNPTLKIYRATLYFFNSNYLATIMSLTVIICAYKELMRKKVGIFEYIIAAFCMVAVYLTGSMFAWIEILIGISMLLLLTKKHQMLSILFLMGATAFIVLYCVPEIFPRLHEANITTENRVVIWRTSIEEIKKNPFFGKGFLTYYLIYKNYSGAYPTTHAHNIILEPLLSFGIIGTVLLAIMVFSYIKKVWICKNYQNSSKISSLILSVLTAAFVHSTTDLTLLWMQTGLLFMLILSGSGYEERILKLK